MTAPEAARLLGEGTLLLSFVLGEKRSHLLTLSADERLEIAPLPPRARVESAVHELLRDLSTLEPGAEADEARRAGALSALLLGPIRGRLEAASRIVVVADGALHGLPFTALPRPGTSEPLIERFEVVHLPSASTLDRQRRTRQQRGRRGDGPAVVIADPVYDGDFSRLPFSRLEAERIARLAGGETLTLLGEAATPAALEGAAVARARLLHVASHAVIDAENPRRSGLVLTGGVAELEALRDLELGADLAVLSGCSTALGKPVLGEGFIGLVHGLLEAGARRVLASLWPVDDRAAAELFERFYTAHLVDGLTPAAALRRTQLELRRDPRFADPWHWAAFVHVGDWQPRSKTE